MHSVGKALVTEGISTGSDRLMGRLNAGFRKAKWDPILAFAFVFVAIAIGLPACVEARDIFVNNVAGDDRRDGASAESRGKAGGPVRTISCALKLAEKGLEPIAPPSIGAGGLRICFLHPRQTQGVLFELVEYPRD